MKRSARDERGIASMLVVVLAMAMVLASGLAFDGGEVLAAKVRASDEAAEAARAGAQAIAVGSRGSTTPAVDSGAAQDAAQTYLAATGHEGSVSVTGTVVSVTVRFDQPLVLLRLAGFGTVHVVEASQVDATTGIVGAGQ
jgi:Flp pilus assembly protein TadG